MHYADDFLHQRLQPSGYMMHWGLPISFSMHLLLVFGLGFVGFAAQQTFQAPTMEVTIVQTHSDEQPDDVKFIAQANQQASGVTDKENRPRSPLASLTPTPVQGLSPIKSVESAPEATVNQQLEQLAVKKQRDHRISKKPVVPPNEQKIRGKVHSDQTQEIAQLLAEVAEEESRYAKRPRVHYLSALSAKSAVEAKYIDEWVNKIERIGTINFPKEAIDQGISGDMIVNVVIDQSGHVVKSTVEKSSGSPLLDQAALNIVNLASPYLKFSPEIREKWDQLSITRTWSFHTGRLETR